MKSLSSTSKPEAQSSNKFTFYRGRISSAFGHYDPYHYTMNPEPRLFCIRWSSNYELIFCSRIVNPANKKDVIDRSMQFEHF